MTSSEIQYKEEKLESPIDGSKNCFRVYTEPETDEHYLCMSTGYMTTTQFKAESESFQNHLASSPKIVNELQFVDHLRGLVWIPCVLNMGKLGIIFPEGSRDDWIWKYASIVDIPKEEQHNYPVPKKDGEFYETKLDLENAKRFSKDKFYEACDAMGIIEDSRVKLHG